VWWLAHGEGLTTKQVAQLVGLNENSSWRLMSRISRVLPIYQDEDMVWQVCAAREGD